MKLNSLFSILFILTLIFSSNIYAQDVNEASDTGGVDLTVNDNDLPPLVSVRHPGAVVGPLLQTQWGMGVPYKSLMLEQSRFGCVGVAVAQMMRFHRHPTRGMGRSEPYTSGHRVNVPSVNFENFIFDWDNTINRYRSDGRDSTELQRRTIGEIYYHIAVGIRMNFGRDGVGGGVTFSHLATGMTTFFGYDRSLQRLHRIYYDDTAWEAIIKAQLDAGLPVMYRGNNRDNTSDHAFIIDGYDNAGRFHVNWGWNGTHNGWYSLDALNPGNRNFSYNQAITINIKPDQGGVGNNEMALIAFSVEKNTVRQNEQFNVTANVRSLGFFTGGHVGVALIDNSVQGTDSRIAEIIGMNSRSTSGFNSLNPAGSRTVNISCYIPETIRPGQYRLGIVIKPEGGNWRLITLSAIGNGIPNVANITVNSHTSANPGGGYGLSLERFSADNTSVSRNENFSVTVRTRKLGEHAFPGGQLGVALVDNRGNIIEVIRTFNWNTLNPGSGYRGQTINNCSVPNTVSPGRYQLMIVTRPTGGEWRIVTLSRDDTPISIDFTVR